MRYLFVLLLAGCATSTSGVMRGTDTFTITGKNTTIGATADDVMTDLHRQAVRHCGEKKVEVVRSELVSAGLARFPEARLEFRCVAR